MFFTINAFTSYVLFPLEIKVGVGDSVGILCIEEECLSWRAGDHLIDARTPVI
jgi:hypothetical protein